MFCQTEGRKEHGKEGSNFKFFILTFTRAICCTCNHVYACVGACDRTRYNDKPENINTVMMKPGAEKIFFVFIKFKKKRLFLVSKLIRWIIS